MTGLILPEKPSVVVPGVHFPAPAIICPEIGLPIKKRAIMPGSPIGGFGSGGTPGGSFSPDDLFDSAQEGVFIDLDNYATNAWLESTRTTNASSNGDRLGAIDDESGNANHFLMGASANEPTLYVSGADSAVYADIPTSNQFIVAPCAITSAVMFAMMAFETSSNDPAWCRYASIYNTGDSTDWQSNASAALFSKTNATTTWNVTRNSTQVDCSQTLADDTKGVFMVYFDGSNVNVAINDSTPDTSAFTANFNTENIQIFKVWDGSTYARGRIYSMIVIERTLSAGEIANCWTWFGDKVGLTL